MLVSQLMSAVCLVKSSVQSVPKEHVNKFVEDVLKISNIFWISTFTR